jgi:uncharacterized membrane protein YqaE (UPF0057 family)
MTRPEFDYAENAINKGEYSMFKRVMYGGMGHGVIIIPTHIFKILFTIIFPPLGIIIEEITNFLIDKFPYITWDGIKHLLNFTVLNKVVYSFLLTSLFYIPGLLYTLANLTVAPSAKGTIVCNPDGSTCAYSSDVLAEQEAMKNATTTTKSQTT